jgi:c-di-GMP-binding flagellar brake protein YcgR
MRMRQDLNRVEFWESREPVVNRAQVFNQSLLPAERRRHLRVRVPAQIEIRTAGSKVPMRMETADLSLGGCYVEMALTLEIGARLDIVLWLNQEKVCAQGVVVTSHPQFGNGIQFDSLSTAGSVKLAYYLDPREDTRLQASVLPI